MRNSSAVLLTPPGWADQIAAEVPSRFLAPRPAKLLSFLRGMGKAALKAADVPRHRRARLYHSSAFWLLLNLHEGDGSSPATLEGDICQLRCPHRPMKYVSVFLSAEDSLLAHTLTDKDGRFELECDAASTQILGFRMKSGQFVELDLETLYL